jgi:hypothetical protein
METSNLQLTPEMRAALLTSPDGIVYLADPTTRKTYLLFEQGALPELEEDYIRDGLDLARDQIARGEVSEAPIAAVIAKAKQRHSVES